MLIDEIVLTPAHVRDRNAGLLAYVRFRLDGAIVIDGVTLRRTRDGRPALSFPARRDRQGREHPIVRPVNDAVRVEVERRVFEAPEGLL